MRPRERRVRISYCGEKCGSCRTEESWPRTSARWLPGRRRWVERPRDSVCGTTPVGRSSFVFPFVFWEGTDAAFSRRVEPPAGFNSLRFDCVAFEPVRRLSFAGPWTVTLSLRRGWRLAVGGDCSCDSDLGMGWGRKEAESDPPAPLLRGAVLLRLAKMFSFRTGGIGTVEKGGRKRMGPSGTKDVYRVPANGAARSSWSFFFSLHIYHSGGIPAGRFSIHAGPESPDKHGVNLL